MKIKFEIDFREPYIDFKKDMIKTWGVPFQNQKMSENDKELIHTRVKDFLLGNFKSKVFYFED